MISLNFSIDDSKALSGMLALVIEVIGKNQNADNVESMTAESLRASGFRKQIIAAIKESEEALANQLKDGPAKLAPASPAAPAAPPVAPAAVN